jgi:uncharacterized membrane protein YdbT with pleckstrin-like domain
MGITEDNLVGGEQVVLRARPHWAFFIWPILSYLFLLILVEFILKDTGLAPLAFLILFLFGLFLFLQSLSIVLSTEFAVTNRRIIAKTGLIKRHSLDMMLTKVESININQGLFARIFNYGDITVIGSGGTSQSFRAIAKPMELRAQVNKMIAGST